MAAHDHTRRLQRLSDALGRTLCLRIKKQGGRLYAELLMPIADFNDMPALILPPSERR